MSYFTHNQVQNMIILLLLLLLLNIAFVGDTAITMARQLQFESRKRVMDTKTLILRCE
jgi:hypothetical protein